MPSSPFLNDVAVSEATGNVYVSDNRNDTLYGFNADGGAPRLLVKSPSLEAPNGLLVDERPGVTPRLLVAANGPGAGVGAHRQARRRALDPARRRALVPQLASGTVVPIDLSAP